VGLCRVCCQGGAFRVVTTVGVRQRHGLLFGNRYGTKYIGGEVVMTWARDILQIIAKTGGR